MFFYISYQPYCIYLLYYLSTIHMFYLIDMYGFWGSYGFDLPTNPSSVTIAARETWRSAVSSLPERMTSRRYRSAFGDPTGDPTGDHGRWAGEYGWRWCNAHIYIYMMYIYIIYISYHLISRTLSMKNPYIVYELSILPSGKHTKNFGKTQFLMGRSTINATCSTDC